MAKAKSILKAAALDKTVTAATESLSKASINAAGAITVKKAEEKKLNTLIKQQLRKKKTLSKRSKTAAARFKKDANAENKKAVANVSREIKSVQIVLDKARAGKKTVSTELTALKSTSKRLIAYTKAINAADKVLNKPVKKSRKKTKK